MAAAGAVSDAPSASASAIGGAQISIDSSGPLVSEREGPALSLPLDAPDPPCPLPVGPNDQGHLSWVRGLSPAQVEAGSAMPGQGQNQIWVLDLAQRTSYRLTFEGNAVQPVWLPDGRIVYRRDRDDDTSVLVAQPYDRSGTEEVLVEPGRQIWEYDALPDIGHACVGARVDRQGYQL